MFKKITILLVPFVMLTTSALNAQGTKPFKQRKINANSMRFTVLTTSAMNGQGTRPIKQWKIDPRSRRYVYLNRKAIVKGLWERLHALKNNTQTRGRKTGDKPTPQNNPELKSICDQLDDLLDQIGVEMFTGADEGSAYYAELDGLYEETLRVMRRIGCSGAYSIPKLDKLKLDRFKAEK